MDFNDSPEEAEFRARARAWLAANAPEVNWAQLDQSDEPAMKAAGQAWQARKADAGFACISWPREWGGGGESPVMQAIFDEEEGAYGIAFRFFGIGLGMCLPTLMAVGDAQTCKRFVGPALRGDEIWCQLFSEPGAGSDVAASRTRAVRANDGSGDWIVNGQKVWTSGAHYSDYGLLLARTDPDVPKHKGLTMFWLDMRSPGIEVRPIHQASGDSEFNEVFFADVRIRDCQRLGEIGEGWKVALITLMNERLAVGMGSGPGWRELLALARELPGADGRPAVEDQALREKLADWYVGAEGIRLTRLRVMTALSRGQAPGPEASIGKIVSARQMQDVATEALDRLDQFGIVAGEAGGADIAAFDYNFFFGGALRIAGGSDEILKNIIAERVLGLPADIRVDRDVAFKDIPRGR
ncbi:acyl-CoA dehydrogenase [Novosphingobium sp. PC22D]|uniref:acyl-CoA dehydrogenase family protein n=1 Tax=Novosphingobium sp. PC22D TaxID=1962403 RepID=UPI000BEF2860|nr:acyl-CoA dehydrogenase family protein [Novosphingobium sp. PC22D]PEQ10583.1 acyl-CoA dehydrogenase [Novosphingobium sp. PC22D]